MNKTSTERYTKTEAMDTTTFDESAALVEAVKGDALAFESLVRAYQKRAYAIAYGFVGNREDAIEMAQESFARIYRSMDRFDPNLPFYPWLYRIVKNACLNHLKKKQRHGEVSLNLLAESGFDPADDDSDPSREAETSELRRAIVAALDRLSPEHREILVLRHLQELSYTEIAECLGVPQGTVMSRLHAARTNLRKVLEERGGGDLSTRLGCREKVTP